MTKNRWKVLAVILAVVAYVGLLGYIESVQSDYDVVILAEAESYEFDTQATEYVIPVTVDNQSNRMLSSIAGQDVFLTYHVYDTEGNVICDQNIRSSFPKGIFAKDKGEAELHITAMAPGEYIVGIDIVQEGVAWFSAQADVEKKVRIIVK